MQPWILLIFITCIFVTILVLVIMKCKQNQISKLKKQIEIQEQHNQELSLKLDKNQTLFIQIERILKVVKDQLVNSTDKIEKSTTNTVNLFSQVIEEISDSIFSTERIIGDVKEKLISDVRMEEKSDSQQFTLEMIEDKFELVLNDVLEELSLNTERKLEDIQQLDAMSTNVKKILPFSDVIKDIALKTKILALNATVEAARAGVHGKAFSVVASEVQNLSEQSLEAAERIENGLNNTDTFINDAIKTVKEAIDVESRFSNSTIILLKGLFLDVLNSILKLGSSLDKNLGESSSVKSKVENIILNLQFEDITKQITQHTFTMLDHILMEITKKDHDSSHLNEIINKIDMEEQLYQKVSQNFTMNEERKIAMKSLDLRKSSQVKNVQKEEDDDVTFF